MLSKASPTPLSIFLRKDTYRPRRASSVAVAVANPHKTADAKTAKSAHEIISGTSFKGVEVNCCLETNNSAGWEANEKWMRQRKSIFFLTNIGSEAEEIIFKALQKHNTIYHRRTDWKVTQKTRWEMEGCEPSQGDFF